MRTCSDSKEFRMDANAEKSVGIYYRHFLHREDNMTDKLKDIIEFNAGRVKADLVLEIDPFITLSFLVLSVIPEIRLTDKGAI